MSDHGQLVETRTITREEAEQCAREQVQFIGEVQPHGFVLVVEHDSGKIVQHSDNVLTLLSEVGASVDDRPLLGHSLFEWLTCSSDGPFQSLMSGALQIFTFGSDGIISNNNWECFGIIIDEYVMLEFFPTTSKLDSYQLILNLDRMVNRIKSCENTNALFHILTEEFQKHANYDRVMLYRFLPDWSGEVVAETVSERTEIKFLGMRFPAEDIPKQARELYKTATLRIMSDVDAKAAKLVPAKLPNGKLLNQSSSVLRGMSQMHIAYLKNMGIKASMSIALMSGDKLWGLVALHHYTAKVPPNHLVSEMKASCELFADIVVSHLHPALNLEEIQQRIKQKEWIDRIFKSGKSANHKIDTLGSIVESIFPQIGKGFVGICFDEKIYFKSEEKDWQPGNKFIQKMHSLLDASDDDLFESECLMDPRHQNMLPESPLIAGLLAKRSTTIPELIVFFGENEVVREIRWGGKPHTINIVDNDGERRLEPRGSFDLWCQKVEGCSDEWQETDRQLLASLLIKCEDFILHSKSEQVKSALHETSYKDMLTGLPNRRFLESHITSLASNGKGAEKAAVFFIDLDNFKRINDFLGHSAGDSLLIEVAERISHCVRPNDFVARLGGDEFVVVIRHLDGQDTSSLDVAKNIADKIIAEIGRPFFNSEQPMVTTPSIGAVICDLSEISFGEVLKRADIAMYRAKNSGKNRIHFFNESDQNEVNYEVQLEMDLRRCLEAKELDVYYQAKLDRRQKVTGAEALARWKHPTKGMIPPDLFIGIAEKHNLITELGNQVIEMVCKQIAQWNDEGTLPSSFSMAINVSPIQLLAPGFEAHLKSTLEKYAVKMSMIKIEITESLFMQNYEHAKRVLQSLRDAGVTVSLDDFGTGYSSLGYLWKLPIDEVKIDRTFVSSMADDDDSLTMVEGIISLCKKLKTEVVAEGVEDKVHFALLKGLGCDLFQGFYFARPEPSEQFKFS